MLLYSLWFTNVPSLSLSSLHVVLMGIFHFLTLSNTNFLMSSTAYLNRLIKIPSLGCWIWSQRNKFNSPILFISNSLLMCSVNSSQSFWPKYNVIHIDLHNKKFVLWSFSEQGGVFFNPWETINLLSLLYHALGAYLSPYKALLGL